MTVPTSIGIDGSPIRMASAIETVRQAFRDFDHGHFDMPVRTTFAGGRTSSCPCITDPRARRQSRSFASTPDATPAISGVVVWSGPDGELVADAADLTALRTGAVSGVATDLLAAPDCAMLTIIGAGAQALSQVAGILAVRPIVEVPIIARRPEPAAHLAAAILRVRGRTWPCAWHTMPRRPSALPT